MRIEVSKSSSFKWRFQDSRRALSRQIKLRHKGRSSFLWRNVGLFWWKGVSRVLCRYLIVELVFLCSEVVFFDKEAFWNSGRLLIDDVTCWLKTSLRYFIVIRVIRVSSKSSLFINQSYWVKCFLLLTNLLLSWILKLLLLLLSLVTRP